MQSEEWPEITVSASARGDVLLPYTMPQAEYMYGCTPTAVAMLLGYYDRNGYNGYSFSNLIEGDVELNARGRDGNAYNMNAFDTVLGSFIASKDYVYRFYSQASLSVITGGGYFAETTPAQELQYSFVNGGTELNTSIWNCLADYLGTGQYWRGQDNLWTSWAYNTLENVVNTNRTVTITGGGYSRTIDWRYTTMTYGLLLYVESRGYSLDYKLSGCFATDTNGGRFTFENYMSEIDAGRFVVVNIEGHSMVGYGYNAATREIIFDDTYRADQRMTWNGTYYYSGASRKLMSIAVVVLEPSGGSPTTPGLVISGIQTKTQSVSGNVTLADGARITGSYPAALRVQGNGFTVTLAGNNVLSCSSIRNAAILFGEDAYWVNTYDYGLHYDGTVNFEGNNISLFSSVSACITAAGIVGNNLTVNFKGAASGAQGIVFESTNGANAGNYAYAIKADLNLTINGDFGGSANSHFDFTNAAANRSALLYGFSAGGNLTVNGTIGGTIYLSGVGATTSSAYGLHAKEKLTVTEISGVIAATAQNKAYGLYGKTISATVSGTLFAGQSSAKYNMASFVSALKNFSANRTELLSLSSGHYAVYSTGAGTLRFNDNALVIGGIYLGASGSSITLAGNARFYGDITTAYSTAVTVVLSETSLDGTRLNVGSWNKNVALTLNASALTAAGSYSIASGSGLATLASVTLVLASGSRALVVGSSVTEHGMTYRLAQSGTSLVLSLSGIDTVAPVLNGLPSAVQNESSYTATVKWAAATDNVAVTGYELRIGGDTYTVTGTSYTTAALAIGTYSYLLRAFDAAGNYSDWSSEQWLTIRNHVSPGMEISANITDMTNRSVTVSATFFNDAKIASKQYRIGNGGWSDYTGGITVSSNTTVYFKVTDTDGKITEGQYTVSNIDKTAPTVTVRADTVLPTNRDVTVTAEFADNVEIALKQYRLSPRNSWLAYTGPVALAGNGTVYFRATDTAGNVSTTSYTVSNIDKIAPAKPAAGFKQFGADTGVVSAVFAADSVWNEYSLDNVRWHTYTAGIAIGAGQTVYFRSKDEAGNVSSAEYKAVFRGKSAVAVTLGAPSVAKSGVTLSWRVTSGLAGVAGYRVIYSLSPDFSGAVTADTLNSSLTLPSPADGTYYWRLEVIDTSGGGSYAEGSVFVVRNGAPATPVIRASTTEPTGQPVVLTAEFPQVSGVKEYSFDMETWHTYRSGVSVTDNRSVYFRFTDRNGLSSAA